MALCLRVLSAALPEIQVWLPEPTLGSSQLPVPLASENPAPSFVCPQTLYSHTHTCIQTPAYIHKIKNKLLFCFLKQNSSF